MLNNLLSMTNLIVTSDEGLQLAPLSSSSYSKRGSEELVCGTNKRAKRARRVSCQDPLDITPPLSTSSSVTSLMELAKEIYRPGSTVAQALKEPDSNSNGLEIHVPQDFPTVQEAVAFAKFQINEVPDRHITILIDPCQPAGVESPLVLNTICPNVQLVLASADGTAQAQILMETQVPH